MYSSIFCSANIGSPAVICPTNGRCKTSWLSPLTLSPLFPSNTSIALGLVASLLMYPNFSSLFK